MHRLRLPQLLLGGSLLAASIGRLECQLAITEVMSSGSTNLGAVKVDQRPDFWELTNFGTNTVDLTGCRFRDEGSLDGADSAVFQGVQIKANESIVFVSRKTGVCTNEMQFRSWWGETNVPPGLQVRFYSGFSFSSSSDAVQLWRVTDTRTDLIQRVELHQARQGFTFTYDAVTGELDRLSVTGQEKAFKAVETDDVGSPGWTVGPAPLTITQQPESLEVDAGMPATFRVRATGLPKAQTVWQFNGADIAGATADTLTLQATKPDDAGSYTAVLDNGVEKVVSAPVRLVVNATASPARIVQPPKDLSLTPNQTARFMVVARGYPLPAYQWQRDGNDIEGATDALLEIPHADGSNAGTYCVRVWNPTGSESACAELSVGAMPLLVITEMFGYASTNAVVPQTLLGSHGDWWELLNRSTNAVDVTGYRFDDYPGGIINSLVISNAVVMQPAAVYVTNRVVIQPGECLLFLSDMSAETFASWWGEENLPETTQYVCYAGNGFQAEGDSMTLWNATATDDTNWVAHAEYFNLISADPVVARMGVSQTFWCGDWIEPGQPSVLGECGALRAADGDDVGSPGFVVNHQARPVPPRPPRCVLHTRSGSEIQLVWTTQSRRRYELQFKNSLNEPTWSSLRQHQASGPQTLTSDDLPAGQPERYYRLVVLPDVP